jgi:hypothetical protein
MAEVGGRARVAGWLLLGIAAVALDGCFERHEPANPFIGPFGDAEEGSFGALPAAPGSQDPASAAVPPLAPLPLPAPLPLLAQADAGPASPGASRP